MSNSAEVEAAFRVFDEQHSKDGPPVRDGLYVRYPSGAIASVDRRLLLAPPVDHTSRLRKVCSYWECRLEGAVRRFDRLRWQIEQQITAAETAGCPPPSGEDLGRLERLRSEIAELERCYAQADESLRDAVQGRTANGNGPLRDSAAVRDAKRRLRKLDF